MSCSGTGSCRTSRRGAGGGISSTRSASWTAWGSSSSLPGDLDPARGHAVDPARPREFGQLLLEAGAAAGRGGDHGDHGRDVVGQVIAQARGHVDVRAEARQEAVYDAPGLAGRAGHGELAVGLGPARGASGAELFETGLGLGHGSSIADRWGLASRQCVCYSWVMTNELTPDPRESKLPAWAQDLLQRERQARKAAQALAESAALATKPDESGAVLDRYDEIPIGLGADPRVAFRVPFP